MNKGIEVNVLFGDGSERKAIITPAAINLARRFAGSMPSLFEGTGFNPLNADVSNIVAITRADHEILHQVSGGQRKADFRLGQMDMKESIIDMLQHHVDVLDRCLPRAVLQATIEEIRKTEVPNGDS